MTNSDIFGSSDIDLPDQDSPETYQPLTPLSIMSIDNAFVRDSLQTLECNLDVLRTQSKKEMDFSEIKMFLLTLPSLFPVDMRGCISLIQDSATLCSNLVKLDPIPEFIYTNVLGYIKSVSQTLAVSHTNSSDIVVNLLNLLEEQIDSLKMTFVNENSSLDTPLLDSKSMYLIVFS